MQQTTMMMTTRTHCQGVGQQAVVVSQQKGTQLKFGKVTKSHVNAT